MARIEVTIARCSRQADARFYYRAESDKTLAKMTYILTSGSQFPKKASEDRATKKRKELVARISVSDQRKLNNTNQGENSFEAFIRPLYG